MRVLFALPEGQRLCSLAWRVPSALGLALCAILAASAAAQTAPSAPAQPQPAASGSTVTLTGEEALAVALPLMLANGESAAALELIQALPPERRARADIAMVEAQLLRDAGASRRAVDIYRRLLGTHRDDQRIRLELAQSLFELKDLRASEHYFRLALSGQLPEADRRLARAYLNQILQLRPWSITWGVGIAPDSNVNNATAAREIELWGLPFELSDTARARSGVNINGHVQAEGSIKLGDAARLVGSAWAQANETRHRDISSEGLGVRLGPEFAGKDRRWSIAVLGEQRWYGGRVLYKSAGAGLNGDLAVDQGLSVYSGGLTAQRLNYETLNTRDGWLYGADLQRTRYLSPRMFWRAGMSLRANRAQARYESYDSARVSAGLYTGLPWRLGVFVEPSVMVNRYRGRDPLFGVVREDREWAVAARLTKEDYTLWGFAPYVGGQLAHAESTIRLFQYDRSRGEVGVTRTF